MNERQYKWMLILTMLLLFLMMGWCGMAMAAALPILPGWVLESRRVDCMTVMVLVLAAGLITTYWQHDGPCPLPQMLMSCLFGTGYVVMKQWEKGGDLLALLDMGGAQLLKMAEVSALSFPAVTMSSFLFTLLLPRERRAGIKAAFLNLLMLILMILTADSLGKLLNLPNLEWTRVIYSFSGIRRNGYVSAIRHAMAFYMKIPPIFRAGAGAIGLWIVLPNLYRESLRRLNRVQTRTPSQTQFRTRGTSAQMNARDLELLDALAAQTIAGNPVGLNTETGSVGLRRRR